MKLLVCGSRDYNDHLRLYQVLDAIHDQRGVTELIEGEAKGADTLAREWAESHNIPVRKFPADWATYGRAAGPLRNTAMLVEGKPNLVVAFPKNGDLDATKGTRNMVRQARTFNIEVMVI